MCVKTRSPTALSFVIVNVFFFFLVMSYRLKSSGVSLGREVNLWCSKLISWPKEKAFLGCKICWLHDKKYCYIPPPSFYMVIIGERQRRTDWYYWFMFDGVWSHCNCTLFFLAQDTAYRFYFTSVVQKCFQLWKRHKDSDPRLFFNKCYYNIITITITAII